MMIHTLPALTLFSYQ